jgi:hypothetical protein
VRSLIRKQRQLMISSGDTGPDSDILNRTKIEYTIRATAFGPLLIALQNGQVCMLNQGGTETELLAVLENRYPSSLYLHSNISDSPSIEIDSTTRRIEAILDAVDMPA